MIASTATCFPFAAVAAGAASARIAVARTNVRVVIPFSRRSWSRPPVGRTETSLAPGGKRSASRRVNGPLNAGSLGNAPTLLSDLKMRTAQMNPAALGRHLARQEREKHDTLVTLVTDSHPHGEGRKMSV